MKIQRIKGRFLTHTDIYFEKFNENLTFPDSDFVYFHCVPLPDCVKNKHTHFECQHSLISDISNLENIKLPATIRNEISRSKKEDTQIDFFDSSYIISKPFILDEFAIMYKEMYKEKKINRKLNIATLKKYAEMNKLFISCAKINDLRYIFHSYIVDGNNCKLLHSCSNFRIQDKELYKAIGRANKYLHWCDWENLNKIGCKTYDWGGISSIDNPNGIDKFKMQFKGLPITYYNIEIPITLKAKLFFVLKKIFLNNTNRG